MSDLGLLLRKAREQHGYTLDDIQEATKIRKRYLEAIELGDYKVLPGSFYVRAFVKTYAETVGLDAEEVLRLYHKELPKPATPETPAAETMMKPKSRSRTVQHNDRWGKVAVTLLMWLFPILIIALVYVYVVNNYHDKAENSDRNSQITKDTAPPSSSASSSPSASLPASPPPSESSATPSSEPVQLTLTRTSGSTSYYDVGPAGVTHRVKIETEGGVWVGVQTGSRTGKYQYNGTPRKGDVITYEFTGPIFVNVGSGLKSVVSVDDTVLDDGEAKNSRKFQLNPIGAAESESPQP